MLIRNLHRQIAWPTDDSLGVIIDAIKNHTGFPGVVGAVDGSHISIKCPQVDP